MHRKLWTPWLLTLITAVGLGCGLACGVAAQDATETTSWRSSPLWDDGLAEFAAYSVDWSHYGRSYPGRALLITVKEPWAPDLEVKADRPRDDGFEVLKLNHVRDVATGIYTYHQMASLFWRRDDGTLRKATSTSSEACGITTSEVLDGQLRTHSYFDGQGIETRPLPQGALLQDGLPVSLRSYVAAAQVGGTVRVLPSLMTARLPALEPAVYAISRTPRPAFEVPAGTFDAVEIRLEGDAGTHRYVFTAEAPHSLLELRQGDGTVYRLEKIDRLAYWSLNEPGAQEWLPQGVRH